MWLALERAILPPDRVHAWTTRTRSEVVDGLSQEPEMRRRHSDYYAYELFVV
jgi:hypothetical protein